VCTDLSLDEVSGALGERWQVLNSYLKPYACARWIHPALDALGGALSELEQPAADAIEAIDVDTFAFAASLDAVDVRSDLQARFSLPRCAASLAVDGRLDAAGFLPGRLERAEVADLAARVRLHEVPEFSAALPRRRPTRVTVRLRDGRIGSAHVENARGNPDQPLSADEIGEKYRRNCADVLAPQLTGAVRVALLGGELDGTTIAELARGALRLWA
jgi:2-methylcitrate dehydratase PrpD